MKLNEKDLEKVTGGTRGTPGGYRGYVGYYKDGKEQLYSTQIFATQEECIAVTQAKAAELAIKYNCQTKWETELYDGYDRTYSTLW